MKINGYIYKRVESSDIGLFINLFINLLQFIADILNPNYTFEFTSPLVAEDLSCTYSLVLRGYLLSRLFFWLTLDTWRFPF